MGSMCDPYMPLENELNHVRKALELIDHYGFGVTLITKSDLVLRDIDLLKKINQKTKCVVQMTLTTYDEELCQKLEPHVCTTKKRIEVLKELNKQGIPTIVWLTPILPFINDTKENIMAILKGCFEAGVKGVICFGMGVTLREGSRDYYYQQLDQLFPGMKEKYQSTYNDQYTLNSPHNRDLMNLFFKKCQEVGIDGIILPDLPYEESQEVKDVCYNYDVTLISMIAPTSKDRVEMIAKDAKGFIYLVSSMGVTGTRENTSFANNLEEIIDHIHQVTDTPVAIGFGINKPEQVKEFKQYADGVIVGSAIVNIIKEHGTNADQPLKEYIQSLTNEL